MFDQYLYNRYNWYKDSYNYYDIDVDRILLYKKVTMNILLDLML